MDKQKYWERRTKGLRGQGDKFYYPRRGVKALLTVVGFHDKPDWPRKEVTKKALLKNSKRARKLVD